jgi:23S rRNA pseudouridine1911/1915/1917 synthase
MQLSDLIIYQTNQFIVANKPAGLPIQPDQTGDKSLFDLLSIYCKSEIFVVHRIDRPVSGAVVFAKNKNAAALLSQQFQEKKVDKKYLAIVKDAPATPEGELVHFMQKQGTVEKIFKEAGKHTVEARLSYKHLAATDNYHLLEVVPHTGRFHQIRAQLGAVGSPIKGDVKYGAKRGNLDRSIHLHSWKIGFHHPVTNEWMSFVADLPQENLWQVMAAKIAG